MVERARQGESLDGLSSSAWNRLNQNEQRERLIRKGPGSLESVGSPVIPLRDRLFCANRTEMDLIDGSIVGLGQPVRNPRDGNLQEQLFKGMPVGTATVPDEQAISNGTYGIVIGSSIDQTSAEVLLIGWAVIKVKIKDVGHKFARPVVGETGFMESAARGGMRLLYPLDGNVDEEVTAAILLDRGGGSDVIPMALIKKEGLQGTRTTPATWTYDATFPGDDTIQIENFNPTDQGHEWVRPPLGQMSQADFGFFFVDENGEFKAGWINEQDVTGECELTADSSDGTVDGETAGDGDTETPTGEM